MLRITNLANLNSNITIHTNSSTLIETLTTQLQELEDENWRPLKNRNPIRALLANL
ncbi:hypothetical protein H1R20_g12192, partial [Candolleomyces eurysporus]